MTDRNQERDHLDVVLDEALAAYVSTRESASLCHRILAQEDTPRRRPQPLLLLAIAASVCALLCVTFTYKPRSSEPGSFHQVQASTYAPSPTIAIQPVVAPQRKLRTRRQHHEMKLTHFPAPAPLTAEERALIVLSTRDPSHIPTELIAFGAPIERIDIPALTVTPLE